MSDEFDIWERTYDDWDEDTGYIEFDTPKVCEHKWTYIPMLTGVIIECEKCGKEKPKAVEL